MHKTDINRRIFERWLRKKHMTVAKNASLIKKNVLVNGHLTPIFISKTW